MSLLDVTGLTIRYGNKAVVDAVDFRVERGASVGLVGASGAGKSQTALALMRLTPPGANVEGSVRFDDLNLLEAGTDELRRLRSRRVAMVFQDSAKAMNPYVTVGRQLVEILLAHDLATPDEAPARAIEALARVRLPDPERQFRAYSHELSGGMRQRVMIAAALLGEPDLLIADEPTTALDVTVQARILDLLDELREDTALLLVTHDLGIVAGRCEEMLIMDEGRLIESGRTISVFSGPQHAMTRRAIDAAQALDKLPPAPVDGDIALSAEGMRVVYEERGETPLVAVDDVSLMLRRGETLAVVGESGSGKTSLSRAILGLVEPAAGSVLLSGEPVAASLNDRDSATRRRLQLVFQEPAASLSPSMTVSALLDEQLMLGGVDARERPDAVVGALRRMGLGPELLERFPHELSGGQAQRVAIARALLARPDVLICDEAVASLDGDTRARILARLEAIQAEDGLAILFISHDLTVVGSMAHRVAVMYAGRFVESGPAREVLSSPREDYTKALLAAVPRPDPRAPGGRVV